MARKRQVIAWQLWRERQPETRRRTWLLAERALHPWLFAGFAAFVSRRRMGGREGIFRHALLSVPAFALAWVFWALCYSWRKK